MTGNRTTEMDSCNVVRLDGVEVQENGIIRDARGWIIGRADTEWMRYQWRMTVSGVCPCCGREVDGDDMSDNRTTTSTAWCGWQIVSPRCYGCLHAVTKFGKLVCYCASRTISRGAHGDTCESYFGRDAR